MRPRTISTLKAHLTELEATPADEKYEPIAISFTAREIKRLRGCLQEVLPILEKLRGEEE